jgi:hypothetical protein
MPATHEEPQSVVDAAQQAVAAGDHASAEQLLREAALLQEALLGPLHPDLANTLNNLGVVCEITDKPADAERCYRRAYAIATAVLEPNHPFVATSRKNLKDFCEARGKPVGLPTRPSVVADEREPRTTSSVPLPRERLSHATSRLFASVRSRRSLAIGLSACGLVLVMFMATRPWFGSNRPAAVLPGSATQSLPESPAPAPQSLPVKRIPVTKETATNSGPVRAGESRAGAASAPASPTVADARLCRDLSTSRSRGFSGDWQCDRPSRPVNQGGSLFFYTRLRSAGDTTVQHRWYRGDHLLKVVELRIRANPTDGYRTYSRNIVGNSSGGDWRVELRTRDGILLHEERFVVR